MPTRRICSLPPHAGTAGSTVPSPSIRLSLGVSSASSSSSSNIPRRLHVSLHLRLLLLTLALALVSALAPSAIIPSSQAGQRLFQESFATDPARNEWSIWGTNGLFRWDSPKGALAVTWDSSVGNNYFQRPVGTVLARTDDFRLAFDLNLDDIAVGTTPGMPYTFEIAVGFLNRKQATQPGFLRGTGFNSPNVAEFTYFPDSGFGATVSPTVISAQHQFATSFNVPVELAPGTTYHVEMVYTASDRTLRSSLSADGVRTALLPATLSAGFDDFRLDTLAIASYSDAGQDPMFAGSVLAHGWVDNIELEAPEPPVTKLTGGWNGTSWRVGFVGLAGWTYTLERSLDLVNFTPIGVAVEGVGAGGAQYLDDPTPGPELGLYRVRVERP